MGGFVTRFITVPETSVVLVGCSGVGKTTILYKWKNEPLVIVPTPGFNVELIGKDLLIWDLGGSHPKVHLNPHFYQKAAALIYVFDASNSSMLSDSIEELEAILTVNAERLASVPMLVLLNKIDVLPNQVSLADVETLVRSRKFQQRFRIQACSAISGEGLQEGLDWLRDQVGRR